MSEESKKSSPSIKTTSIEKTFKDLEKIGSGGNASVYSAVEISTGDKIALKIYDHFNQPVLEGIIEEFNLIKLLTSDPKCPKGILQHRDYFSSTFNGESRYVSVTDLIDGVSMDNYISKH